MVAALSQRLLHEFGHSFAAARSMAISRESALAPGRLASCDIPQTLGHISHSRSGSAGNRDSLLGCRGVLAYFHVLVRRMKPSGIRTSCASSLLGDGGEIRAWRLGGMIARFFYIHWLLFWFNNGSDRPSPWTAAGFSRLCSAAYGFAGVDAGGGILPGYITPLCVGHLLDRARESSYGFWRCSSTRPAGINGSYIEHGGDEASFGTIFPRLTPAWSESLRRAVAQSLAALAAKSAPRPNCKRNSPNRKAREPHGHAAGERSQREGLHAANRRRTAGVLTG